MPLNPKTEGVRGIVHHILPKLSINSVTGPISSKKNHQKGSGADQASETPFWGLKTT